VSHFSHLGFSFLLRFLFFFRPRVGVEHDIHKKVCTICICSILKAVFRIRDILRRIRILGSVHCITNPEPALFVEVPTKNKFFYYFLHITYRYCRYIYNSLQRQQVVFKTVKM
jgi:hypothetical protein